LTKVRFLPAAEIELLREIAYYSEGGRGAGLRLQVALEAAMTRIARHPLGGARSFANTRTALVRGFPLSIIYRLSSQELLIVAIAPHRKRPFYWVPRIE